MQFCSTSKITYLKSWTFLFAVSCSSNVNPVFKKHFAKSSSTVWSFQSTWTSFIITFSSNNFRESCVARAIALSSISAFSSSTPFSFFFWPLLPFDKLASLCSLSLQFSYKNHESSQTYAVMQFYIWQANLNIDSFRNYMADALEITFLVAHFMTFWLSMN